MKTRFLLLATAVLPLLGGCTNANSETGKADTNAVVPSAPAVPRVAAPGADVPVGQPVNLEVTPPATVKLSPAAGEITKLVQSGVDSSVVLAYVANSRNTFRLEAEEIVYLKDIGMSPAVVTAMINRDQQLREASGSGATASATPAPSAWSAGQAAPPANTWQQAANETAPAAQPSTATTVPPPPEAERPSAETVNYFYDELSPYGTWIDVDGYGRCWRPTAVATTAGWRPYSNCGRWEWTDSGWYWYSDYSWGWAPFHYGRWYSHPRWGWCWMPGSAWASSWVSWRYSDAYCGWAPLPPAACYAPSVGFTYYGSSCGSSFSFGLTWDCFTFVSYNNFHHHQYASDCVPHHQAGQVFNNTTVVNNIIHGNNNTIINQGIAPTQITAASGTTIHQVNIRDARGPSNGHNTRHEEIAHDGRTLNVIRHDVPAGNTHAVVRAHPGTRGGSQNLTTGNGDASVAAPTHSATPQTGLVPPRVSGPRHTVPVRNESPAPTIPVRQSSATASVTAPASAAPVPPRTQHTPNNHPVTAGNSFNQPAAPSAAAPTVTPRNDRSQATPWLNNAPAPTRSQPVIEPSGNTRAAPTRHDTRTANSDTRSTAPSYSAPSAPSAPAYHAPAYHAPATPHGYGSPAQAPAQPYNPPARNVEPRYTPAPQSPPSQPAYTPPRHESAPSYSPPPSRAESQPAPRSESHSSSSGSSSKGSDSSTSRDDRSSRGR